MQFKKIIKVTNRKKKKIVEKESAGQHRKLGDLANLYWLDTRVFIERVNHRSCIEPD